MREPFHKLCMLFESADPVSVEQGIELVRSLGAEAYRALLEEVVLDGGGRLVPPGELPYEPLLALWLEAPAEAVPDIVSLARLDLTGSGLSSLPPRITQLSSLRALFLSNNRLPVVPSALGELAALVYLDLSNNILTALPREIGQLAALERLSLRNNVLASLPREIGQLRSLRLLDLAYNPLSRLPATLGELCALEALYLDGKGLQSLPVELGGLGIRSLSLRGQEGLAPDALFSLLDGMVSLETLCLPARFEPVLGVALERPRLRVHFR